MHLSFCIVNWNGGEVFRQCIASIRGACAYAGIDEYEIVVVDNASAESLDWFKSEPKVKLIQNSTNEFFSRATNTSVRESQGDLIFLLNNDVILHEGCVRELLTEMKNTSVDAVVPRLLNADGSVQQSITGIPDWTDVVKVALGLHLFLPGRDRWRLRTYDYSRTHTVTDQPMFSALCMRRETWRRVGELDLHLPLLWNDVEWFYRFHAKGCICRFVAGAQAVHKHGHSVNRNLLRKHLGLSRGEYYFLCKRHRATGLARLGLILLSSITFMERLMLDLLHGPGHQPAR